MDELMRAQYLEEHYYITETAICRARLKINNKKYEDAKKILDRACDDLHNVLSNLYERDKTMVGEEFEIEISDGTAVDVTLTHYEPGEPMVITGWGFGDAEPPEPEYFEWEYVAYDEDGNVVEKELTAKDEDMIETYLKGHI